LERLNSFLEVIALEGNIRILALQTLVSQVGFGMFYVVWQPFILSTGASVADLGVIQSVINLVTAGGLILWGVLSDKLGRKPVILASNACRVLAMVALIASGSYAFLLVFAFFVGLSCIFMQGNPARNALTSESVGAEKRATAFSVVMSVSQITSTAVASAGGYIAVTAGYYPILYLALAGDLIGMVLMAAFLRETLSGDRTKAPSSGGLLAKVRGHLLPERGSLVLYLIMVVIGFGYGTGFSVFYGMLVDSFGYTELQLGVMSTIFNLIAGLTGIPLGKLSDRWGRRPMLMVGWLMGMASVGGFIISRRFELFLLFYAISALDMNFYLSAWMPLVSEKAPPESLSTMIGTLDSYGRIARIPAPWLGAQLYTLHGFRAPLVVHLACIVVYGILIYSINES
jgi:MFS family permease